MARKPYPTDLTDEQWKLVEPHIPPERWGGRTREVEMRDVVDGIIYLVRNGCPWRAIPHDLANWSTCRHYYDRFRRDGTWLVIHKLLRDRVRARESRPLDPSAAVLDAQSVKCGGKGGIKATTQAKK
jgi:putative transposase